MRATTGWSEELGFAGLYSSCAVSCCAAGLLLLLVQVQVQVQVILLCCRTAVAAGSAATVAARRCLTVAPAFSCANQSASASVRRPSASVLQHTRHIISRQEWLRHMCPPDADTTWARQARRAE
jgi:hypothetical protein